MTDPTPPNNGQEPQQVNLQEIAKNFMSGLQLHFDMLAFTLASRESVEEEAYKRHVQATKIMPAAPVHQNFEQMQAYARDLLVRQMINDSMNLAVTAMNNAHLFLALVKSNEGKEQLNSDQQKAAHEAQKVFVPAKLEEKFNILERDFGIMCELEDTITSIAFCLEALMRFGGTVQASHLDESGELTLELKMLKVFSRGAEEGKVQGKLVDQRKVFKEGDTVFFSDIELQLILVTLAAFTDTLFKSVANFSQGVRDKSGE